MSFSGHLTDVLISFILLIINIVFGVLSANRMVVLLFW